MSGSVIKRGSKYVAIFRYEDPMTGKVKQKWKGGFYTKKDAEVYLNEKLYLINKGKFDNQSDQKVADYLNKWLIDYCEPNLKIKTVESYKGYIENYINVRLGKIPLNELKPYDIQDFYTSLRKKGKGKSDNGLSGTTILQIHRILSNALKRAKLLRLINENPAEYVDTPKKNKYRAKTYDEDELIDLLEVSKNYDIYIPVLLSATLGLRRGEVLGITWDDVDFEKCEISINKSLLATNEGVIFDTTKSEDSNRTLLVPDFVMDELTFEKEKQSSKKEELGDDYNDLDLVCCYDNGDYFHPGGFSKKFAKLLSDNNLPHIRFHDLRHTNATMMLKNNVPMKIASSILGHSTVSITADLYQHVSTDMQRDAVAKMNKMLSKRK